MFGDPVATESYTQPRMRGGEGGYVPMPTSSEDVEVIQRQAPPAAKPREERTRVAEAPDRESLRRTILERRRRAIDRKHAAAADVND
jgi:hypothetical protein